MMSDAKRICTGESLLSQATKDIEDNVNDSCLVYSPKSLLDTCIHYVAGHTHFVESFWGFPDIVGEKIFRTAIKLGKFTRSNTKLENAINPFCDAYGSAVLDTLSLCKQHLVLNNYLETICLFKYIRKLDISCCGLGDNHEILHHLSQFYCIETLSIRGNMLSNDGLRKLTAPIRMFQQECSLEHLDISDNQLTENGLKFIECFKNIKLVNVSANKIKDYSALQLYGLHFATNPRTCAEIFEVVTSGWATPVVSLWCRDQENLAQKRNIKKSSFYKMSEHLNAQLTCSVSDDVRSPVYDHVLVADAFTEGNKSSKSETHLNRQHDVIIIKTLSKCKKARMNNSASDKENEVKKNTNTVVKAASSDEEDLMKMYGGQCDTKKSQSLTGLLSNMW